MTAVPEKTKAYVLQRKPLIIWWAHTDSNRGPKDYESWQTVLQKYPEALI